MNKLTTTNKILLYVRLFKQLLKTPEYQYRLKETNELINSYQNKEIYPFIEYLDFTESNNRTTLQKLLHFVLSTPVETIVVCDLCVSDIEAINYYSVLSDITKLPIHLNIKNSDKPNCLSINGGLYD